ncbi:hypothetical protein WJX74_009950 [Apatococcus lobatus]|uniref:Uncharacterized protein n=1 Tax=Apatococcus lobatus TaxID=904363 RepID=A0AAW1S448_9CHLO
MGLWQSCHAFRILQQAEGCCPRLMRDRELGLSWQPLNLQASWACWASLAVIVKLNGCARHVKGCQPHCCGKAIIFGSPAFMSVSNSSIST